MKKIFTLFLFIVALSASFGCSISDLGDIINPEEAEVLETPDNLSISVNSDTVNVNWNSVNNAKGYNLYAGTSSGNYEYSFDMENETSKIFSNVPNDIYYLVVESYNDEVISAKSSELSVTVDFTAPAETSNTEDTDTDDNNEASANSCDDSSSIGTTGSGGGFVWKPISEGDRNLVVLLPSSYTGNSMTDLKVAGSNGETIETGNYVGPTNGNRETYRFSSPGSAYGDGLYVVVSLLDCSIENWYIPTGADRKEY